LPYRGASRSIQQSGEPGNVRIVLQKSLPYVPSFPEIGAAKVKIFTKKCLKIGSGRKKRQDGSEVLNGL
jgi:hypothetical protein